MKITGMFSNRILVYLILFILFNLILFHFLKPEWWLGLCFIEPAGPCDHLQSVWKRNLIKYFLFLFPCLGFPCMFFFFFFWKCSVCDPGDVRCPRRTCWHGYGRSAGMTRSPCEWGSRCCRFWNSRLVSASRTSVCWCCSGAGRCWKPAGPAERYIHTRAHTHAVHTQTHTVHILFILGNLNLKHVNMVKRSCVMM